MSTEGIDATEAAVLASLLSSDKIPDENQSTSCMACGETMKGLFCHACGQKNDNYRRSIFSLFADLFGSIFSLESRIWRTWGALLFKPGKVSREFADGKRSYWSSPVRVYLAMSIILFGFMSVTGTHLMSLDVEASIKEGVDKPRSELGPEDISLSFKPPLFFETQYQIDKRYAERDMELIEIAFSGDGNNITEIPDAQKAEIIETLEKAQAEIPPELPNIDIQFESEAEDSSDTIVFFGDRKISGQDSRDFMLSFIQNPVILTRSFNTWLPRLMFLMMPIAMLLGALFIRDKQKALLYDHLVHSAYIHTLAFFLLFVGIIASKFVPGSFVIIAILAILIVYLPISARRMFGRGRFKSLLMSYTVGFLYFIVITVTLLTAIAWDMSSQLVS